MKKLQDYLDHTAKPGEDKYSRHDRFARQLGVSASAVRKWLYGQRRISDDLKIKIEKLTHGEVSIRDMVLG